MQDREPLKRYYADAGWLIMRCAELEYFLGASIGFFRRMELDELRQSSLAKMQAGMRASVFLEEIKQSGAPQKFIEAANEAIPLYRDAAGLRNRIAHGNPVQRDKELWIVHWVPERRGEPAHMAWHRMDIDEIHAAIDKIQLSQKILIEGMQGVDFSPFGPSGW